MVTGIGVGVVAWLVGGWLRMKGFCLGLCLAEGAYI